ncbi:MAG: CoA transferase [Deltaproteobacteria bacterium]|nr:CoA transferase [Deltaproteobacteria bacterium]MBW1993145.1 CoA transferase [Deltaproteobacteria bacterium]MBW2151043.1 CoA transferase [Deltaproteobacteria bacterium]
MRANHFLHGTLNGCLVLDLSRLLPGPYCSMILADHGARVICIEHKRFKEDYTSAAARGIHRNKEHMTLDLKTEKGKKIFFALAEKADVILETFRPGVVERLGVGYHQIRNVNPKIIYCSLTGYGQQSPLKELAGHDINYLGHSGILSIICSEDGIPCVPGIQVADIVGGLNAAIGITLALYSREKIGKGQYIDIAMTDSCLAMLPVVVGMIWGRGQFSPRAAALVYQKYACYNIYKTADGKYLTVGALEPRFWETICQYFQVPEYIPLQYSEERRTEIINFLRAKFLEKTRDEWMKIFFNKDACLGAVLSIAEALNSEHTKGRKMVTEMDSDERGSGNALGIPIKLSETPGSLRTCAPEFGEHTRTILKELGYSEQDIARLELEEVV